MNQINLAILLVILSVSNTFVLADLKTDRSVISNNSRTAIRGIDNERIVAIARFQDPISGDLYIATQVNGALTFIANEGNEFSSTPIPFRANSLFSEDIVVLNIMGQGVPPGRYPIFKVVTKPGTNPLDFRNWIGGLGGLRSINFIIGLSDDESLDFDNDGFPNDDLNRDGFHDDEAKLDRLARVKERSDETGDDDQNQNQNELDDDNQEDGNFRSRTRRSRGGE